jgi:hypothetical protein
VRKPFDLTDAIAAYDACIAGGLVLRRTGGDLTAYAIKDRPDPANDGDDFALMRAVALEHVGVLVLVTLRDNLGTMALPDPDDDEAVQCWLRKPAAELLEMAEALHEKPRHPH